MICEECGEEFETECPYCGNVEPEQEEEILEEEPEEEPEPNTWEVLGESFSIVRWFLEDSHRKAVYLTVTILLLFVMFSSYAFIGVKAGTIVLVQTFIFLLLFLDVVDYIDINKSWLRLTMVLFALFLVLPYGFLAL